MSRGGTHVVFVTGLSGSGKSTAMAALEDLGFYCVDNLPGQLIEQFLDLCDKATPPVREIGLAVDARERAFLAGVPGVVRDLREGGARVDVLFLDCANHALQNRYRETRRVHPLSPGGSVSEGIDIERALLEELAGVADVRIDTTELNVHQLRDRIVELFSADSPAGGMQTTVLSFGYKHGHPLDADLVLDCRFLPNPHWVEELRPYTGRDEPVREYVMGQPETAEFLERLDHLFELLLPSYLKEGKSYLTIAVGCTGGQHRSVVIADEIAAALRRRGFEPRVQHRDVDR